VRAGMLEESRLGASLLSNPTWKTFPSSRSLHYVNIGEPRPGYPLAPMAKDNISRLTQSHNAIAAKKRAKHAQIKEIVFDDEARTYVLSFPWCTQPTVCRSFLTGFHKRKVARRELAKQKAQLREKQERLEARREVRSPVSHARSSHRAVASSRARGTGRTECRRSRGGMWGSWRYGNATSPVPS
jgi:hypothetical protein